MNVRSWFAIAIAIAIALGACATAPARKPLPMTPVMRLFQLRLVPGAQASFDAAGRPNITTSIEHEPGTWVMLSAARKSDPEVVQVFEIYADEAAYGQHAQSPQFLRFLEQSKPLLTDKRMTELEPEFLGEQQAPLAVEHATGPVQMRIAEVEVQPAHLQDFREVVLWEMQRSIATEPGVLALFAGTVKGEPAQWRFVELYASDAAYQAHRASPHFQTYLRKTQDMLVRKQLIETDLHLARSHGGLLWRGEPPGR